MFVASPYSNRGLSLIELLIVMAILGIVGSISAQSYNDYVIDNKVNTAIQNIRVAQLMVFDFHKFERRNPVSLAEAGFSSLDPWGNEYQYLDISGGGKKTRKDKNLTPINTDFDLYSFGPDGRSALPLTAKNSRDDIVRANNGRYVGIADGY